MGVITGGVALAAAGPASGLTAGLAGAAIAAALRALEGDSPASLAGIALAPLLALACMLDLGIELSHALAAAAACWTIAELARGALSTASPVVALLPAVIAAVLAPSCALLVPIVGARLVTAPWQRPRGIVAVPIAGALFVLLAVLAGVVHGGPLAVLGERWIGAWHPVAPATLPGSLGDALGPLLAVAALAGLALIFTRVRHAQIAIGACLCGGLLVELHTGAIDAVAIAMIALCAGTAVGRLGAMIRLPAGQALAGVTAGLLILAPPAWTTIERAASVRSE
jgi:hypothetical protein